MLRAAVLRQWRALFLLDQVPPLPPAWDESLVRARVHAARLRLKPAQRLLERGETVAALVLYRDAGRLLWTRVHELLEHEPGAVPPEAGRQAELLTSSDPELVDRLTPAAALSATQDLDRVVKWAIELLDRPTDQQRKVQRRIRFSALGAAASLAIVAGGAWLQGPPNLALGRPAVASSVAWATTPAGAVDGVRYGWLGFHSAGPGSEWWSVDLGQAYALERVAVYGRADCCFDQSVPLGFEVSLDGKKYRRIAARTAAFSQSDPWLIAGQGAVARFVRFRTLRKTQLVLGEVEVYGRATAARSDAPSR
jgi:hypothetical protein